MAIEAAALGRGVEEAEVGGGVRTGGGGPLPAAVIAGEVAVNQMTHEVFLAPAPVDEQILRKKHGHYHAQAIVHPASFQQLAHSGIDYGYAGVASCPCLELAGVGTPGQVVSFQAEGEVPAHMWKPNEYVAVELAPNEFIDPCCYSTICRIEAVIVSLVGGDHALTRREHACGEVGRKCAGGIGAWQVAVDMVSICLA